MIWRTGNKGAHELVVFVLHHRRMVQPPAESIQPFVGENVLYLKQSSNRILWPSYKRTTEHPPFQLQQQNWIFYLSSCSLNGNGTAKDFKCCSFSIFLLHMEHTMGLLPVFHLRKEAEATVLCKKLAERETLCAQIKDDSSLQGFLQDIFSNFLWLIECRWRTWFSFSIMLSQRLCYLRWCCRSPSMVADAIYASRITLKNVPGLTP